MLDIYDFYDQMERNNIMLSFKGSVTPDLLSSILQIMESKMDNMQEEPKIKKRVFNVLVECLQNLYHHMNEVPPDSTISEQERSAIFMIRKQNNEYTIYTGNFILSQNVEKLKKRIDIVNSMTKDELKEYYKTILSNGEMSEKGGGGLGMIHIARKSGQKLVYNFIPVDAKKHFFSLSVKISQ